MPEGEELPPAGHRYFEIEVAKMHGGWAAWKRLPAQERGELLAHEKIRNLREAYRLDKMGKKKNAGGAGGGGEGGRAPWDVALDNIRGKFFGKG